MKKITVLLFTILSACTFLMPVSAETFKKGTTVYVAVQASNLKDGKGVFAKNIVSVSYGDSLLVVSSDKKKTQVTTISNKTGWIATGSLTKKKIIKSAKGGTVKASSSEIALAGKGFSEEAENAYKASKPNLDYDTVDKIETINISESDLHTFAKEGKLAGGAE